jgi:hypothetical protein
MIDVLLKLNEDQALVLFEWLSSLDEGGIYPVQHRAEELVLWSLHAQLETELTVQFSDDYLERLHAARLRVLEAKAGKGGIPGAV